MIESPVAAAVSSTKVGHQKLAAKVSSSFNSSCNDKDVESLSHTEISSDLAVIESSGVDTVP